MGVALLIGIGGFAGALARHLVDKRVTALVGPGMPWGIMLVNVSGSFLVGLLFVVVVEKTTLAAEWRAPLMIGFLGAFTTFSTLMLDSWRLVEEGAWIGAAVNLGGSIVLGLASVIAGIAIGRAI